MNITKKRRWPSNCLPLNETMILILHFFITISLIIIPECHSFASPAPKPRHIAFVCDGNSRWATEQGLPTSAGHAMGAEKLVTVLDELKDNGILYCTMYGFSTENWKRPKREIDEIFSVIETSASRFYQKAIREQVRVRVIGDLDDERIPDSLYTCLRRLEKETYENTERIEDPFTLCLAINYGGRQDILNAVRSILETQEAASTDAAVDTSLFDEQTFSSHLSTASIPDPDMIIRTSGERRLSNFLLWNAAYAELYFVDTHWPAFGKTELRKALDWYASRNRRFGSRIETTL